MWNISSPFPQCPIITKSDLPKSDWTWKKTSLIIIENINWLITLPCGEFHFPPQIYLKMNFQSLLDKLYTTKSFIQELKILLLLLSFKGGSQTAFRCITVTFWIGVSIWNSLTLGLWVARGRLHHRQLISPLQAQLTDNRSYSHSRAHSYCSKKLNFRNNSLFNENVKIALYPSSVHDI